MDLRLLSVYTLILLLYSCECFQNTRIVHTKYGKVQGLVKSVPGFGFVDQYLGIPYATPPVQDLRFVPPVAPIPWQKVYMAKSFHSVCPQNLPMVSNVSQALLRMSERRLKYIQHLLPYLQEQSEDCLYLNIYTPHRGRSS